MKQRMHILIGTTLTCSFFLLAACHHTEEQAAKKTAYCLSDTMMKMIRIDSAMTSNLKDELSLNGEVSFDENKVVKVFPFSSGQVLNVQVSLGDYVKAGQTLAVIKSADIASVYADLESAQADLSIAKKQMENQERLFKNGIGSEREFSEAKENFQKTQSAVGKIKQQIAINGGGKTTENGTFTVSAPRSGYVVGRNINPGNFIRPDNGSELFTIGDIQDVWIWANVYESDIARIHKGASADISTLAFPDKVFHGKVDVLSSVLDPLTKVMKVKVVIENTQGLLKPLMFANIRIEDQSGQNRVSIPTSGIVSEDGHNYVITYQNKCALAIREISVQKILHDRAYLNSGLEAGEKIIVGNQILLFRQIQEADE